MAQFSETMGTCIFGILAEQIAWRDVVKCCYPCAICSTFMVKKRHVCAYVKQVQQAKQDEGMCLIAGRCYEFNETLSENVTCWKCFPNTSISLWSWGTQFDTPVLADDACLRKYLVL